MSVLGTSPSFRYIQVFLLLFFPVYSITLLSDLGKSLNHCQVRACCSSGIGWKVLLIEVDSAVRACCSLIVQSVCVVLLALGGRQILQRLTVRRSTPWWWTCPRSPPLSWAAPCGKCWRCALLIGTLCNENQQSNVPWSRQWHCVVRIMSQMSLQATFITWPCGHSNEDHINIPLPKSSLICLLIDGITQPWQAEDNFRQGMCREENVRRPRRDLRTPSSPLWSALDCPCVGARVFSKSDVPNVKNCIRLCMCWKKAQVQRPILDGHSCVSMRAPRVRIAFVRPPIRMGADPSLATLFAIVSFCKMVLSTKSFIPVDILCQLC